MFITGYEGSAAHRYAKEHYVAYRDAGTGETVRYDFIFVPGQRIKKITAGKKKIKLWYKEVEDATYRIDVKKAGAPFWKTYMAPEPAAVIKGLKPGKKYKVRVCALRKIEGEEYCGHWSKVKRVTVR